MIYLISLLLALNITLLFEIVYWHAREQRKEGLNVSLSKTFVVYLIIVGVLAYVIYWLTGVLG